MTFVEDYFFLYSETFYLFSGNEELSQKAQKVHYNVFLDILNQFEMVLTLRLLDMKSVLKDFQLISGVNLILYELKEFLKKEKIFVKGSLNKDVVYKIGQIQLRIRTELSEEIGRYVIRRFFTELDRIFSHPENIKLFTSTEHIQLYP